MAKYTITTQYNPKPIPDRRFDWDAQLDDDEEFGTGHGETEGEAIVTLAEMIEANLS